MSRDSRLRLEDMLECIGKIGTYVADQSLDSFEDDPMRIDAVLRNLEIIGEASKLLPEAITARYPERDWKRIASLRDVVAHEYFGINMRIIWQTVQEKLPSLRETVRRMLAEDLGS